MPFSSPTFFLPPPLFLPSPFFPPSLPPSLFLSSLPLSSSLSPSPAPEEAQTPHEAVLNLSWALDFSRSGGSCHIREEVDQLYQMNSREEAGEADDLFTVHSDTEEEGEEEEEG